MTRDEVLKELKVAILSMRAELYQRKGDLEVFKKQKGITPRFIERVEQQIETKKQIYNALKEAKSIIERRIVR